MSTIVSSHCSQQTEFLKTIRARFAVLLDFDNISRHGFRAFAIVEY